MGGRSESQKLDEYVCKNALVTIDIITYMQAYTLLSPETQITHIDYAQSK